MISNKYQTIKTIYEQTNLSIILNRPHKRNALNDIMIKELTEAFFNARDNSSVRTISLTGEGKIFCSGADLSYLKKLKYFSYEDNLKDSLNLSKLLLEIYIFPKPVIAIVKGAALAGGCGLASVCDFIVSEPDALFGYPEVKIGFVAALVSTFLIRQVGERKARELLLTGNVIKAKEAQSIGLITSISEKGKVNEITQKLLKQLTDNSPSSMAESKKILSFTVHNDIKKELELLSKINAKFRETDDFLEGINAFLQKRTPKWSRE